MQSNSTNLLCIVLSFNGCNDTLECLKSITNQPTPGFDLLVVDNASEIGIVDHIRGAFPAVEIVALDENQGWAGGNNQGIKIALQRGYKWVCLLNNDTVFPPGEVAKWYQAVMASQACLLHPTIHYWDEPTTAQLNAKGELHGGKNGASEIWDGKAVMDRAYGACLAIPREIFEAVGLFDERLFLQLEETDFYQRAAGKGFKAACDHAVQIFHKESRAFGGTLAPIKSYYTVRNSLLLIEKKNFPNISRSKSYKELYWTITNCAARTTSRNNLSIPQLVLWLWSPSPTAVAIRLAVLDYMSRNFGKISASKHLQIKKAERYITSNESKKIPFKS